MTFVRVKPKAGVLTVDTIEAELQKQSDVYLSTLKQIGSKDDFETRTKDKIVELEGLIEKEKAKPAEDQNLQFVTDIEEAIKTHKNHLDTLEMNVVQAEKNLSDIEDMVDYLNELLDEALAIEEENV